jgi:hypothetical protein
VISRRVTRGGEQGVAGGDHADGVDEFGGGGVLEEEAAGAGAQRRIHVLIQVEGREHQHSWPGGAGGGEDLAGCLQSVHDRHPDVHQDDVGPQVSGGVLRFGAAAGYPPRVLGDHAGIIRGGQRDRENHPQARQDVWAATVGAPAARGQAAPGAGPGHGPAGARCGADAS